MRLSGGYGAALLCTLVSLAACGGKLRGVEPGVDSATASTSSVAGPDFDSGVIVEPDGAVSVPDGDVIGEDGAVEQPDGAVVARVPPPYSGPPAPECTATSTCTHQYVPPGAGWTRGDFSIETFSLTCASKPSVLEAATDTDAGWGYLDPFFYNAGFNGSRVPNIYEVPSAPGSPAQPPAIGVPPGTLVNIRACTLSTSGEAITCDKPSYLAVANCGTCPYQPCAPGYYLADNCKCEVQPPPPPIIGF